MNGVEWTLVESIVLLPSSLCLLREMRGYSWVCGLRSFGFFLLSVIPQHPFSACI
jgi:hypothetical protein